MGLALALAVLDQVTKNLAVAGLERGERVDVLGWVLGLRLFYNSGAAFGLGTGLTPFLSTFQAVAVVVLLVALARTWSPAWALALGVLMGGAVGNLFDRLTREPGFGRGEVVDFLELPNFPIFNVADICVTLGAVSIVLLSLRDVPFTRDAPDEEPGGSHRADGSHLADGSHRADGSDAGRDA